MDKTCTLFLVCMGVMLSSSGFTQPAELFQLKSAEDCGITFNNRIVDDKEANLLIYDGFYAGAGVAIGDLNGDGLQDLYFAGNQVHDQLYINEGDLKFSEVSEKAGIKNRGGWSTGVTMADINNDGKLDIYVCKSLYDDSPELRTNELYLNITPEGEKIPQFKEVSADYGLNNFWRSMQASFIDFDRDGDQDVFLINQPPNPGVFSPISGMDWRDTLFSCRLYENIDNQFLDVTKKAGVLQHGYGLSATAADYNKDGWVDIYVSNDYEAPDFLYINQKDGTFKNTINSSMQQISYFSMGSDAQDIDNDGWIDLVALDMVAEDNYRLKANMGGMEPEKFWQIYHAGGHRQYMFNSLQLNRGVDQEGTLRFSNIAQLAGVSNTDWSWAPLLADFDNDGHKDLFITNGIKRDLKNSDAIRQTQTLVQEQADAFVKANPNAGEVNIWDVIDLQAILDLMPSEKLMNYAFRNKGQFEFEKTMTEWGLEQKTFSTGAAYGDLDNDGDLDLVINNTDDVAFLYENQANASDQHYLRIQLTDQGINRSFFGSKVSIYHDGKEQHFEFINARGYFSSSESLAHFGLGSSTQVDSVIVNWGQGGQSLLEKVSADQVLAIDYSETQYPEQNTLPSETLFKAISSADAGIDYRHVENPFDDFSREVLLPHQMSMHGPAYCQGDVDQNGLEDMYVGGAKGQAGKLYLQSQAGVWIPREEQAWQADAGHEDVGASFFDADLDGDLDLYVVSGGNEAPFGDDYYLDRFYINNGNGQFTRTNSVIPALRESGSKVIPCDFDRDGDIDLFVGGRQIPGAYPSPASSYLLLNTWKEKGELKFVDVTAERAPELQHIGMVTDAIWTDFDGDKDLDLFLTGTWMPLVLLVNEDGKWARSEEEILPAQTEGWWYSIEAADLDQDGDTDFVLGNLGLNYKYKASPDEPFSVHYDDFDQNGTKDIVLSYYNFGEQFPLRGRSCSSQQVPMLKEKFPDYNLFASSTLPEVYGISALSRAINYEAYQFASICLENKGGKLIPHLLPREAQFSSINDILIDDFNGDGHADLIVAGNLFGSEVETARNDASLGLLLQGKGNFQFTPIPMTESGIAFPAEIKYLGLFTATDRKWIMGIANNDRAQILELRHTDQ